MSPFRPSPPPSLSDILATPGRDYCLRLQRAAASSNLTASRVLLARIQATTGRGWLARRYKDREDPHEIVEQYDVACYLKARNDRMLFTHPMNETTSRGAAGQGVALGVSKGCPDLLIWGRFAFQGQIYGGLAIELKRRGATPGKVRPEQRAWLAGLESVGWLSAWCRGAGPAVALIDACFGYDWLPAMPRV